MECSCNYALIDFEYRWGLSQVGIENKFIQLHYLWTVSKNGLYERFPVFNARDVGLLVKTIFGTSSAYPPSLPNILTAFMSSFKHFLFRLQRRFYFSTKLAVFYTGIDTTLILRLTWFEKFSEVVSLTNFLFPQKCVSQHYLCHSEWGLEIGWIRAFWWGAYNVNIF